MSSVVKELFRKNLINPPSYVIDGTRYETIMGSVAYGVANTNDKESMSDIDIYGFCIPHKDTIFPHLRGEILGFGRQLKRFDQYQQHHIKDTKNEKEYDITIYSIIKYFQLTMSCNPNMIDSLFTPINCVIYSSKIADLVRDSRQLFLHKGAWFKFKNYSFSMLHKMKEKNLKNLAEMLNKYDLPSDLTIENVEKEMIEKKILKEVSDKDLKELYNLYKICTRNGKGKISKRLNSVRKYGFDLKFSYNVVRLLGEIEQIMVEGNLDLQRNKEQLKSIRRGEWTIEDIENYFTKKERDLEKVYSESKLRNFPDEDRIKQLLINCLEEYFGNLNNALTKPNSVDSLISDVQRVLDFHAGRTNTL